MFLNFLKNYLLKRKLKNSLANVINAFPDQKIRTIGILIDESYFSDRDGLVQELVQQGFSQENIGILVYKDKVKKNEIFDYPTFSLKDVNWIGDIEKAEVTTFVTQNFDLLINYYNIERAALLLVSQRTKANFKVGFPTIDKRINHFMINTDAENYKVFSDELFRYLKILNKI